MFKAVVGDVLGRTVILVGIVWAVGQGWSLPELFLIFLAGNLTSVLVSFVYVSRLIPLTFRIDLRRWGDFIRSAWPLGVTAIFSTLYFKGDMVILSVFRPPDDVGIYSAAYKVFEVLIALPTIFMSNVLPSLSRLATSGGDALRGLIQTSFDILVIIGVGASFGLAALSTPVIRLIAGQEFVSATTVSIGGLALTAPKILALLSVALVFIFIANLWSFLIIAQDRQRQLIQSTMAATVINLSLNLIFIPHYSYLAAAVTTIVTEMYIFVSWGRIVRKTLDVSINWDTALRSLGAGLGMLAALQPLQDLNVFALIVVGGSVYMILLWALGVRQVFATTSQIFKNE